MSPEHIETVKELTGAFHRRDIDAFADLRLRTSSGCPFSQQRLSENGLPGPSRHRDVLREVSETWDEFRPSPEEYRVVGERVLALGRLRAQGRGSRAPVDAPWAGILDFRGAKICRIRTYLDHAEALGALGLVE
jgi:ketosteroid isomerase-like protein